MKYYQILYNSSQSQRDGGVGFGIRAVSDDLPEEYIAPIVAAKYFENYELGSYSSVGAKDLFENPSKILNYPLQYSYTTLKIAGGRSLYILKRCIPLGFDYAYYKSGEATRLGNYVVHLLIFEEKPHSGIFDLLYEQPAPNSAYFIPKQRVPDSSNDELKWLMLDKMPPLEATTNICVESMNQSSIDTLAYNIFFSYIEALKQRKALIVKIEDTNKNIVIADLYRLMGEYAPTVTFSSGVYSQNISSAINITFINEYYSYPLPSQNPTFMVCDAKELPTTNEYVKYNQQLSAAVNNGDNSLLHKISKWLLSEDYLIVKDCDEKTSLSFFNYSQDPDKFTVEDACDINIIKLIANKSSNQDALLLNNRLAELLLNKISDDNIIDVCNIMNLINEVKQLGVNIDVIINKCKQKCCDYILAAPSQMILIYEKTNKESFDLFVVKESFVICVDFIEDMDLIPHIKTVWKYFFTDSSKAIDKLLSSLLLKVECNDLTSILKDANSNAQERISLYVKAINKAPNYINELWDLVIADLGNSVKIDIFKVFVEHYDNPSFAKVFYFAFKNTSIIKAEDVLSVSNRLMLGNPAYKQMLIDEEKKNKLYPRIFDSLLGEVSKKRSNDLIKLIEDTVLTPFANTIVETENWHILSDLLNGNYDKPERFYDISKKINDKCYFEQIAYLYLDSASSTSVIEKIVKDLIRLGIFKEDTYLNKHIVNYKNAKQTDCIGIYFRCKDMSFEDAYKFREDTLFFYEGEDVFLKYYEKEYNSYLRKQKVKGFFKNMFSSSKKEEKEIGVKDKSNKK
ncbi:MAG: hypothetical protein R3Y59_04010 [bacterium]